MSLRAGVREGMVRTPGFSVVALLTLALGIGANTAIFSMVHGVLLRPLPYARGENVVFLTEWSEQVPSMSFSVENFKDLRDRNGVFEAIGAYRSQTYASTGGDLPERLAGREVSAGIFDTLRLKPVIGRVFRPEEDRVCATPRLLAIANDLSEEKKCQMLGPRAAAGARSSRPQNTESSTRLSREPWSRKSQ